ncbi:MAG: hypothetical protein AB1461_18945 [Thermodesulfobacteriota bacterium]
MRYRRARVDGGISPRGTPERQPVSKGERGPATPVCGTPHPRRRGFCEMKQGQVTRAADWPYSSIHRYIEAGMMDHDWGGGICGDDESGYGERE